MNYGLDRLGQAVILLDLYSGWHLLHSRGFDANQALFRRFKVYTSYI